MPSSNGKTETKLIDCGLIDYDEAFDLQMQCVRKALDTGVQFLLLCEHPAVITLGRSYVEGNLLLTHDELQERSVAVRRTNRGGDITLHCPGQLVVYPVLDLVRRGRDLHRYLHDLEQVGIDLLRRFGIVAQRNFRNTGVWSGERKLISIGVGVKKWISFHGMSINVNPSMNLWRMIRPCGLEVKMTSIEGITGKPVAVSDVKPELTRAFTDFFNLVMTHGAKHVG